MCSCVLLAFQNGLTGEEGLSEEEKAKRRAERRRAKRKVSQMLTHTQRLTENTISKGTLSCFLVNIKERDIVHFLFSVKESARNLSAVKKMNSLYRYTAKLPRLHTFHSLK